jgi:uncharacterized protein (TIGR00288 family)
MKSPENGKVSNIALMVDFDNIAISAEQYHKARFDVGKVIDALRDRGRVIIKRAYADWKKWANYQNELLTNAVEMVHVPFHGGSNKNNSDIKMAVDAIEAVYANPLIDTFVIASGDSDFQSLVTKLRENGKYVVTVGVRKATSDLLIFNSDEFISYESLLGLSGGRNVNEGYNLLVEVIEGTVNKNLLSLSNIKNLLLQRNPSFNEKDYGFGQFKNFILSAEEKNLITIDKADSGREMYLDLPRIRPSGSSGVPAKRKVAKRRRKTTKR